ncbi:hypothetical protein [Parasphingorhabdus pacifica]
MSEYDQRATGDGPEVHPATAARPGAGGPAMEKFRNYINALVGVIADHPEPSLERDEAQWRIEELADELSATEPSAPRVRSRWLRLAPVLLEVRPDVPVPALNGLLDEAFNLARKPPP